MSTANSSSRFEAFLAICIALATVIGAVLAALQLWDRILIWLRPP